MNCISTTIITVFLLLLGFTQAVPSSRIVGGVNATIEEIPWQAAIHYLRRIHRCSAAIINRNTIITAAHCFENTEFDMDPYQFVVRVGTNIRSVGGEIYDVEKIIRHPKFNLAKTNYNYDIAIMKLTKKLQYNEKIQPIALPKFHERLPVGEFGLVAGWGRLSFNGEVAKILQKIVLPIMDQEVCQRMYKNITDITDNMFCAAISDGRQDACKGDSGAPFVVNRKLVGIVSWGIDCGQPEYPGVFTNVANLKDWIQKYM